jgi:hypothetical protein
VNEMMHTGMYALLSKKRVYLDDPKERQRYVKYMTPKQKERFAKSYIRSIFKAKEQDLWLKRMLNK